MAKLCAAAASAQCALERMRTAMCNYPPGGYVPPQDTKETCFAGKASGLERRCNAQVVTERCPGNRTFGRVPDWCSDSYNERCL